MTCQDGPEIKSFVEEDLETLYARAEYKFVCKPGVGPVALFKDQEGELVETVQLEGMKRFVCQPLNNYICQVIVCVQVWAEPADEI